MNPTIKMAVLFSMASLMACSAEKRDRADGAVANDANATDAAIAQDATGGSGGTGGSAGAGGAGGTGGTGGMLTDQGVGGSGGSQDATTAIDSGAGGAGDMTVQNDAGGGADAAQVDASPEGDMGTACECRPEYIPVCGVDGNTYDNACEAACANIEIARPGACDPNACVDAADCGDAGPNCDYRCIEGRCSPNCGTPCMDFSDCAPGQACEEGRCSGAPECPSPDLPGVRVFGVTIEECERLAAQDLLGCEADEQPYNDACGCGCIGDGGQPMECDCPDIDEPACGFNGVTYRTNVRRHALVYTQTPVHVMHVHHSNASMNAGQVKPTPVTIAVAKCVIAATNLSAIINVSSGTPVMSLAARAASVVQPRQLCP